MVYGLYPVFIVMKTISKCRLHLCISSALITLLQNSLVISRPSLDRVQVNATIKVVEFFCTIQKSIPDYYHPILDYCTDKCICMFIDENPPAV